MKRRSFIAAAVAAACLPVKALPAQTTLAQPMGGFLGSDKLYRIGERGTEELFRIVVDPSHGYRFSDWNGRIVRIDFQKGTA